jgi:hypothetical protein
LGARALARGSHLDSHEQRNDYTKRHAAGKEDVTREFCYGYQPFGGLSKRLVWKRLQSVAFRFCPISFD